MDERKPLEEGGETVFPESPEKPHRNDPAWSRCAQEGVSVKVRRCRLTISNPL